LGERTFRSLPHIASLERPFLLMLLLIIVIEIAARG
jgi:hypothetical protein